MTNEESRIQLREILSDRNKRKYACEKSYKLFSLTYFTDLHRFRAPKFHDDMYADMAFELPLKGVIWEMFRESSKTSLAKIKFIHDICYGKTHFAIWVAHEEHRAAGNLFDIAYQLQTNKKLIADFGQLFYDSEMKEERTSKKKSIKEFITANGIKVKAYSTGQSIRGEVHGADKAYRPDLICLDDIENLKTVVSESRTREVTDFIDEMFTGAAGYANYMVLANKLSYSGSIAYLEEKVKNDKEWVVRDVKIIDETTGKLSWPEKYAMTDAEAEEYNKDVLDKELRKTSLETLKRRNGQTKFNREYMNQPLTDEEREIKLSWLQHYFTDEEVKQKTRNRYITIDVADSKARAKTDPDYTATTVVDWDIENYWYLRLASLKRMNSPELIDWIFYLWETYKPIKIGVEKKALEDQVMPYIRMKSDETKIYPVVVELKHGGTRKEDRIRGALQGRLQYGKIKFRKGATDDTDKIKEQLYDFPKGRKDDGIDALAYIEQIGNRPYTITKETFTSEMAREFWENKRKNTLKASTQSNILKL